MLQWIQPLHCGVPRNRTKQMNFEKWEENVNKKITVFYIEREQRRLRVNDRFFSPLDPSWIVITMTRKL